MVFAALGRVSAAQESLTPAELADLRLDSLTPDKVRFGAFIRDSRVGLILGNLTAGQPASLALKVPDLRLMPAELAELRLGCRKKQYSRVSEAQEPLTALKMPDLRLRNLKVPELRLGSFSKGS